MIDCDEAMRRQKRQDGWLGTVATPRWFLYPSLLLWICAGAWWAGVFDKPETFAQCVLRNMRGEPQSMNMLAAAVCKDDIHYALRDAGPDEQPVLPNGSPLAPKSP